MMRRLALIALLALWPALASAQVAYVAPTVPAADNGDRIATTAWVNNFVNGGMPLANGKIWIGSAGGIATPQTAAPSATIDTTNASNISSGTLPAGRLPLTNTSFSTAAATPTGTSSASALMIGAGVTNCKLTPTYSGRVSVHFDIASSNASGTSFGIIYSARFGTGAAPINGAAATGTTASGPFTYSSIAGETRQMSLSSVITGLTPGTAYWFDIAQTSNGSAVVTPNYGCSGFEF